MRGLNKQWKQKMGQSTYSNVIFVWLYFQVLRSFKNIKRVLNTSKKFYRLLKSMQIRHLKERNLCSQVLKRLQENKNPTRRKLRENRNLNRKRRLESKSLNNKRLQENRSPSRKRLQESKRSNSKRHQENRTRMQNKKRIKENKTSLQSLRKLQESNEFFWRFELSF